MMLAVIAGSSRTAMTPAPRPLTSRSSLRQRRKEVLTALVTVRDRHK